MIDMGLSENWARFSCIPHLWTNQHGTDPEKGFGVRSDGLVYALAEKSELVIKVGSVWGAMELVMFSMPVYQS